jgi:hypothetical protein
MPCASLALGVTSGRGGAPDPNLTGGSVRIDGHDIAATCGHAKDHRGTKSLASMAYQPERTRTMR